MKGVVYVTVHVCFCDCVCLHVCTCVFADDCVCVCVEGETGKIGKGVLEDMHMEAWL